jgi:hypothetical protein
LDAAERNVWQHFIDVLRLPAFFHLLGNGVLGAAPNALKPALIPVDMFHFPFKPKELFQVGLRFACVSLP